MLCPAYSTSDPCDFSPPSDFADTLVSLITAFVLGPVASLEVVEIGEDMLEIVAKLVASAIDPNELNAVATDLQHLPGVRHATWEASTTE
jgi:putative Mg2+ transporter-C (MgtC) family protein